MSGGLTFVSLGTGGGHTCGLTGAGAGYCWGGNIGGQLGISANSGTGTPNPTPTAVSGGLTLIALTAGAAQSCGVISSGAAYCWGNNRYGQLGNAANNDTDTPNPSPLAVTGGLSFVAQ